jgi:hypothetical protein
MGVGEDEPLGADLAFLRDASEDFVAEIAWRGAVVDREQYDRSRFLMVTDGEGRRFERTGDSLRLRDPSRVAIHANGMLGRDVDLCDTDGHGLCFDSHGGLLRREKQFMSHEKCTSDHNKFSNVHRSSSREIFANPFAYPVFPGWDTSETASGKF